MIQFGLVLPLVAGGIASAAWRQYKNRQIHQEHLSLPSPDGNEKSKPKLLSPGSDATFDDVGELYHYQRMSWYTLAFAASGSWFYAPAVWISFPLLGYNTYHFINTIRNSDPSDRKSPMTIFEVIGVVGTLLSGRPVATSLLLLFSFGSRKLLLQAGNISNSISSSRAFNPKLARVWVLREGVEVETAISDLQEDDIIVIHAGDTVAVKGKVIEGTGTIQQFSLRKKMKFVPKQTGDKVFPFTQLESGCLHIQPA
ncbi:MAG: E1-E2 ATPase-associated domain protein [uncultured Thiotrichaceae bacterium]|uniref:E1-E2 ATPase-associated domain protein n=1 Tax=uncultured Thiotrichaceae bacterium TaxID=298394 RepID=A0A6S6U7T8_9GAMM|nr:MAG: E1-E2 ATPase-associated domain protein [uncultured Thiotrichaceae bacterium]